jgi:hypothetical protein
MGENTPDDAGIQAPKQKTARKAKPKGASEVAGKRALNLSVSTQIHLRLATHSLATGVTMSDIVSQLVEKHLRDYHITRSPNRDAG